MKALTVFSHTKVTKIAFAIVLTYLAYDLLSIMYFPDEIYWTPLFIALTLTELTFYAIAGVVIGEWAAHINQEKKESEELIELLR